MGEAPGESEDSVGLPFVGRSGKVLDEIIYEAGIPHNYFGMTNTIICTPFEDESRDSIRTPNQTEIKNCSTRLKDLITTFPPEKIISVGDVAKRALTKLKIDFTPIVHPAFIIRQKSAQAEVLKKRTILIVKKVYESLESELPWNS